MLQFLKTKTFRIGAVVLVLVGLYALLGFVVAPKLVRSALLKDIPETLAVTPAVGEIHINPFLFQVTVDDFSLAGAGGEQLVGFKRLFVDFQLSSIWHRAYSFINIDLTSPYVNAAVARDGTLNLQQLQPKPGPAPKPEEKSGAPVPALRIGSFKVLQGLVTYEDRSRPDAFAARLEPINFELREFTTGVQGGQFTFTGSSKLGERVEWHGHLSVQPVESDGEFQVNGLLAHTLWEYLQDRLNFVIDSGSIDLAATYKFALKDAAAPDGGPKLQLDVAKVGLSDLKVRPKGAEAAADPWLTVPELTVTGTTVDLSKRLAHVDLVSLSGVKLTTWLEPDGSINLMKLAASPAGSAPASVASATAGAAAGPAAPPPAASTAPGALSTPGTPANPTTATHLSAPTGPTLTARSSGPVTAAAPWTYDLRQLDLRDVSISAEDRSARPTVKLLLAPFSLQVNGASQDLTKPVSVTLDTRINEKGSLNLSGEVTPQPLVADLKLKVAGVGLSVAQPYIARYTAMTLVGGSLGADGTLHYSAGRGSEPALQFTGNINVDKLHTVDDALHDDFINWDRLDIHGLNYSQGPDRLDIDQVTAKKLYARVIIEADESINVKRVLTAPGAAPQKTAAAAPSADTAAADSASSKGAARSKDANRPKTANRPKAARNRAAAAPASSAPAAASMPMSIKKITVQNSQANFADLSVMPNFSTGIQKLNGTVVGLSSKPGSRAKVDLQGSVDAFSPVSIVGEVNVLGPLFTDLKMSFRNIALAVFNPYSGKFAGYNITKGNLTTELHYKVDGRKLDAQHHIVIDQLEFGEKTASKDAVSLPVKLAVSLLKDRNGVIDLDLPVTGSLDDPKFRLGPIIWKVFVNILEKAVTAPFALLGSLFGAGPDIQFIDFQPGVGALDAPAADKVKTVGKALIERPQLKIEVPIGVVPEVDGPALVSAQFKAELASALPSMGGSKKAAAAPPSFDQLDPAAQLELLTRVYKKDTGGEPKFPDTVTDIKSKPDAIAAKIDFLNKVIREHIVVGEGELQALGQQRAKALQEVLLSDPQVTAERVFLVSNDKATAKDGAVRLELSLQ